jgi:hypothetical protein
MAQILSQLGIETSNTVEAWHVTQSIDAFTGVTAYDITLSGSFTLQNGTQGANKIAVSDANGKIDFTNNITASLYGTSSWSNNTLTASYALNALTSSYAMTASYVEGNIGDFGVSPLTVVVATSASLPFSPVYDNGPLNDGVGAFLSGSTNGSIGIIDGVTVVVGDRILVKNQSASPLQNGVYEVTQTGSISSKYIITRTIDSDETSEFDPQIVIPSLGSTNQSTLFAQTTDNPSVGVSSIFYIQTTTNVYVTQTTTGTQTLYNIPWWTGIGKQLSRGTSSFQYNPVANRLTISSSLAQGLLTTASGVWSHAEGYLTLASGNWSHAEGIQTTASFNYSHAEGGNTLASGFVSHAEGQQTISPGQGSHAEGRLTLSSGSFSHAEGSSSIAFGTGSHAEGFSTISSGSYSHAEGYFTLALGAQSHAEGQQTTASGAQSHAEGYITVASGGYSHAEGSGTISSGDYSHAEGAATLSSGTYSHAEGQSTIASGQASHASGLGTIANRDYMSSTGRYNVTSSTDAYAYFVVGKGTSNAARSNAFRVSGSGECLAGSTFTNGGADYAEYFESHNGQSIPVGTTVELTGSLIKICEISENAIGVISNKPSILGNSDEGTADEWVGKYEKDIWGNYIMEDYEYEMFIGTDAEGNMLYKTIKDTKRKFNPNYDPTMEYIPRAQRPEWNVVGLLGQIKVLKNQQIPSRWIKMKDINDEIAIYLVK